MSTITAKNLRASDTITLPVSQSEGFSIRKKSFLAQAIDLLTYLSFIAIGTALIVYFESVWGSGIVAMIGVILYSCEYRMRTLVKSKQSTEFMNALFTSALAEGSTFCAVVKLDGHIVYLNRDFQSLFPNFLLQDNRALSTFLEIYKVPADQRAKLQSALEQGSASDVSIDVSADGHPTKTVSFSVAPISRPTGFVLLRGK